MKLSVITLDYDGTIAKHGRADVGELIRGRYTLPRPGLV
jgi:hypothetical protein